MLKSLKIENFQSHTNSEIIFSPTVTSIIGLNNHGKSAIIRALKKIIRNEPEGTSFIRHGAKETKLTLVTSLGKILRQVKVDQSNDSNLYCINDKEKFIKFGKTGIPTEVLDILDISESQTFGELVIDINFQNQFDTLFLITGQGLSSVRGKVLSKITGIDKVQRALQLAANEEKQCNQEVKRLQNEIFSLENALQKYSNLDNLFVQKDIISKTFSNYENLSNLISTYSEIYVEVKKLTSQAKVLTGFVKLIESYNLTDNAISEKVKILTLMRELVNLSAQINTNFLIQSLPSPSVTVIDEKHYVYSLLRFCITTQNSLKKLQNFIDLPLIDVDNISFSYNQLNNLIYISNSLNQLENFLNIQQTAISDFEIEENSLEQTYNETLRELEICPLCGNKFKDKH